MLVVVVEEEDVDDEEVDANRLRFDGVWDIVETAVNIGAEEEDTEEDVVGVVVTEVVDVKPFGKEGVVGTEIDVLLFLRGEI